MPVSQPGTTRTDNGIDVSKLVATIDAITQDPSLGSFTFRAFLELGIGVNGVNRIAGGHLRRCPGAGQRARTTCAATPSSRTNPL